MTVAIRPEKTSGYSFVTHEIHFPEPIMPRWRLAVYRSELLSCHGTYQPTAVSISLKLIFSVNEMVSKWR